MLVKKRSKVYFNVSSVAYNRDYRDRNFKIGRVVVGHTKSREIRTYYKDDGRGEDVFQAAIELANSKIEGTDAIKHA